jgi:hypothetical protein
VIFPNIDARFDVELTAVASRGNPSNKTTPCRGKRRLLGISMLFCEEAKKTVEIPAVPGAQRRLLNRATPLLLRPAQARARGLSRAPANVCQLDVSRL